MNAAEFNTEINKLTNYALREGLLKGNLTPVEFIGVLSLAKFRPPSEQ